jgi:hypothetical protein
MPHVESPQIQPVYAHRRHAVIDRIDPGVVRGKATRQLVRLIGDGGINWRSNPRSAPHRDQGWTAPARRAVTPLFTPEIETRL